MAVAAETQPIAEQTVSPPEEYAHSLSTIRRLGSVLLAGASAEATQGIEALARDDFYTGIGENLRTDAEFRDELDIDPSRFFAVRGGQTLAADGRPMVDLLRAGLAASQLAARADWRMQTQVDRDQADLELAERVDRLRPGELYLAVSMDPKQAMQRDGADYWQSKGYRQGLAFLQFYYKHADGSQVTAGAYSVDHSDQSLWRQVQAGLGVAIPADTPADQHIRYGLSRSMDSEAVLPFVAAVRDSYYTAAGDNQPRRSLTSYIMAHSQLVETYFESYVKPLARAVYTGCNNQQMQTFAQSILQSAEGLKPEVRQGLLRIGNSENFDAQAGRLMESLVRYAVVEQLRQGLHHTPNNEDRLAAASRYSFGGLAGARLSAEVLNQQAARNIQAGVAAGRSYGGCSAVDLAANSRSDRVNQDNPQDAYGGRRLAGESGDNSGECVISTNNCYCCGLNSNGSPRRTRMTVQAVIDKNKTIHCLRKDCGAWLSEGGARKNIGGIARRAAMLAKQSSIAIEAD